MGDKKLIVKSVVDNPLIPVYQYTFEGTNIACAVNLLSDYLGGPNGMLSEDQKTDPKEDMDTIINTGSILQRTIVEQPEIRISVFFKPNLDFVDWIKEYANGRLIMDVGCGQGHLVRMLKRSGAKCFGIEPLFDYGKYMHSKMIRGDIFDPNEIMPYDVTRAKSFIDNKADKLLIFARPCHSTFVEEALDYLPSGQEALYITLSDNLENYNDLGKYKHLAIKLDHKGISEDSEVVYSITKP